MEHIPFLSSSACISCWVYHYYLKLRLMESWITCGGACTKVALYSGRLYLAQMYSNLQDILNASGLVIPCIVQWYFYWLLSKQMKCNKMRPNIYRLVCIYLNTYIHLYRWLMIESISIRFLLLKSCFHVKKDPEKINFENLSYR